MHVMDHVYLSKLYDIIMANLVSIEPYPPPVDVSVRSIMLDQITFGWAQPSYVPCTALHYHISSSNCGRCPNNVTHTSHDVTCTDVVVNESVCSLAIQAVVCDTITGNVSIPVFVLLKGMHILHLPHAEGIIFLYIVPDAPNIKVVPYYYQMDHRTHNYLTRIRVSIEEIVSMHVWYTMHTC